MLQYLSQPQTTWPHQGRCWRYALRCQFFRVLIFFLCGLPPAAQAMNMGLIRQPQEGGGTTMVFFPTLASETQVSQGPFRLSWAENSAPLKGNGRLIVVSHGSGGSPWVHTDLARTLTQHGFVVAIPQHAGDNYLDFSEPGPPSWKRRPLEVSQAINQVSTNPLFAPLLRLDAVGVFGGSAGGHTALSFAGGEWSPARFRDHCMQHIADDFSSCVGFATRLHGTWLDSLKLSIAKLIIRWRFDDETSYRYTDKRVRAVVAMVPFAADFSAESLKTPQTSLGLVIAEKDINQVPRFHVKAIQSACEPRCQILAELIEAGHGAMLSPLPPFERGSIADHLLSDPPSFDRAVSIPKLNAAIAKFFVQELTDY
ncbi:alpha/beta hydrolase family protein [Deefgea piscis]|uniref:alpha/beta hydrolase family protein n=1 Tax=Deefgea piscis TaxID=2739061 RepID=UPI001C2CCEC3|nr:hypothetical protein [Deefgea piscis]